MQYEIYNMNRYSIEELEEVAKETLSGDMSYDFINLTYQEKHSPGGGTVFLMATGNNSL